MFKKLVLILLFFMMIGCVSATESQIANESVASGSIGIESPIANELQNILQYDDLTKRTHDEFEKKSMVHDDTQPNQIDDPTRNIPESYPNLTKIIHEEKHSSYELIKHLLEPIIPYPPIIYHTLENSNQLSVMGSCDLGNSNNNPIILNNNPDQPNTKNLDVKHSFKTTKYNTNYSQIEVHIYNQSFYNNDNFVLKVQVDNNTQCTYTLYDNKNPYQTAEVEFPTLKPGKHNISVWLEKTCLQISKGYDMYHNFDFDIRSIPIDPEYTWELNTTFIIPPR